MNYYKINFSMNNLSSNSVRLIKTHFMKKYICNICGWIYDPAEGVAEDGIAPGTDFESLPDSFVCPICQAPKNEFSPQ